PENGPRVLTEFRAGRVGPDLNLTEVAIARRGPAASAAAQATTPGAQTGTAAPARADTGAPEAEPKENPWVRPGPKASDASKIWAQAAQQAQAPPQVHQAGNDGIGIRSFPRLCWPHVVVVQHRRGPGNSGRATGNKVARGRGASRSGRRVRAKAFYDSYISSPAWWGFRREWYQWAKAKATCV